MNNKETQKVEDNDYELWLDSILHPWGEIPNKHNLIPERVQAELISRSLRDTNVSSPQHAKESKLVRVPPESVKMDEAVLSTVRLRQHSSHLKNLVESAEKYVDSKCNFSSLPPAPELPRVSMSWKKKTPAMAGKEVEDLCPGRTTQKHEMFELTRENARKILRKAVGTIFAAQGFEGATRETLDIVTEVAETYMENFVKALRIASDKESATGSTGFLNILERVFAEMGVGSTTLLSNFHEQYVLPHFQDALNTCKFLTKKYEDARLPPIKIEPVVTPKTEIMEVEEDIVSQIHFPAVDETYLSNPLQPSLELGFQMLQSLELAEHMQNIKQEENITFHTSAGYSSTGVEDGSSPQFIQTSQDPSLPLL